MDPNKQRELLDEVGLLAQTSDEAFDRFTRLAARLLRVPVAQLNVFEDGLQFSKSSVGPGQWLGSRTIPEATSFCRHVVQSGQSLVISDSRRHPLGARLPLVQSGEVGAYLGVPLMLGEDTLGALCVIDFQAHEWSDEDVQVLSELSSALSAEVELRHDRALRQSAERKLREQEATYREIFSNSPLPIWVVDPETLAFLDVNQQAVRRYGYSRDEFLRMTLRDVRVDDMSTLMQMVPRALSGSAGVDLPGIHRHRRRDGSILFAQIRVGSVQFQGRSAWMAIIEDVTERQRTEAALHSQEARFRALTESSLEIVTVVGPDGTVLYESSSILSILGYTPEELVGRNVLEFIHPDDLEEVSSMLARVASETKHSERIEIRFRHADGSWCYLEAVGVNYLDDPSVQGIVFHSRDMTARRRAEDALRESEERFQQLAAGVREVFWMFDAEFEKVLYVSPTYEKVLGRDVEQFRRSPRSCLEGVAPADRERTLSFLLSLRDGPKSHVVEILRPDGERRWLQMRGFPVRDARGEVYRIAGTTEDITEQRQAEAALRAAKEEAERASRAKSEFLSRMSHELRTPMNAILGFAQVLEMDLDGEEDQESVQQILRAGRHLLSLIDEVLDLAKIEAERISLSLEPVCVANLIRESLELVRSMAAEREVSFRTVACDHFVRADQQRFKQVLLNLLSNAIKYNREGGTVTISCAEAPEDRLRIQVADTGRGLTAEQRGRIFAPFERLGIEGTGIPGTGLGLSLSKGLVEAMGGEMGVDSVPGEGSTFWVELPSVDAPEGAEAVLSPEDAAALGSGHKVLYIEDNLSNVRLIERIFARRPDLTLIPAMQGRLGLDLAREHHPDLILLDVHLPDLRGDQVLAELQRDPGLREIPVVVISADATPRNIEMMREAGAREYLTKPIDVSRFLVAVDSALPLRGEQE